MALSPSTQPACTSRAMARMLAAIVLPSRQRNSASGLPAKSGSLAPTENSKRSKAGKPCTPALPLRKVSGASDASSALASDAFSAFSTAFLRSGQKLSRSPRKSSAIGP